MELILRLTTIPVLTCTHRHIHTIPECEHEKREVIEAVDTGLAIMRTIEDYTIVHVAGSTPLTSLKMSSLVACGLWLKDIAPLFDWTLPPTELLDKEALFSEVHQLWMNAMHRHSVDVHGK